MRCEAREVSDSKHKKKHDILVTFSDVFCFFSPLPLKRRNRCNVKPTAAFRVQAISLVKGNLGAVVESLIEFEKLQEYM